MQFEEAFSYDDLLLVPKYSEVSSRAKVDTSVKFLNFEFKHPIVPANMKTVSGKEMAEFIYQSGGMALLHRFMPIEEQLSVVKELYSKYTDSNKHIGVSVGVKQEDKDNIIKFIEAGVKIFCIDIAHGNSKLCSDMCIFIKSKYPDCLLIAGNVATGDGALRLWRAGADVVKAGVGNGSLCSTRIETGNGVPQMSALIDIFESRKILDYEEHGPKYIMCDGGIKAAGEIVKVLCFSEMVMVGSLFSGTDQTPGETLKINGISYKEYVGSSTHKTTHIEGVAALVPTKGDAADVLEKLLQGLKSGCSYQGCDKVKDLQKNPKFVRITSSGLKESVPHNPFTITGK